MQIRVSIEGEDHDVRDEPTLDALLVADAGEIWIEHATDGPHLCALIEATRARGWLMYMDDPGGYSWSSRNPRYRGDADAVIEYRLSNGQVDEYPASWAYPIDEVRAALREFATSPEPARPASIAWQPD